MVENQQRAVNETPKKRKRKTEAERLLEESKAIADVTTTVTEDNPWTDREDLEVLRIHEGYHGTSKAQARVERLNDMMQRIRTSQYQKQQPGRTADEFKSRVRELQNDGVTIEDLEAVCFPVPPKKKRKQGGK